MAIVRELVTVLGTEFDATGLKQYESGIGRVKSLALGFASAMGLAFSVDKIIEFADGLMDAGKEVNKLTAQLKLILRPMDDINTITQGVFDLSQRLGVSYTHMLGTYREFANEVRDTKIPTEDILAAVENIQKGFEVARASPEEQHQVMEALQRGFRSGKMRPVSIGLMKDILPPEAFNMLLRQFNLGVGDAAEEKLRELAKEGKVTAEAVIAAFKKTSTALNDQFNQVPQKLGRVFTRIYNDLVNVTSQIYKIVDSSVFMGKVVWFIWNQFTSYVKSAVEWLGGLKQTIELVSIAIGVVMVRALVMATAATIRWAIASWAAILPWLAIGVAIAAVAVGIQDLMYWVQNKHSLIGTWVGPFEKLKENFSKLDIFAGFRLFSDIMKGDWKAAWEDAKIAVSSVSAIVLELTTLVGVAFAAWVGLKFLGLIGSIGDVVKAVAGVGTAAKQSAAEVAALGSGGKGSVPAVPGATPGAGGPRINTTQLKAGGFMYALNALNILSLLQQQAADIKAGKEPDRPLDTLMQTDTGKAFESWWQRTRQSARGFLGLNPDHPLTLPGGADYNPDQKSAWSYLKGAGSAAWERMMYGPENLRAEAEARAKYDSTHSPFTGPIVTPPSQVKPTGPRLLFQDWDKSPVSLPPGAMGPPPPPGPVTNNVQPVFNQNNNIKVETTLDADQIGRIIGDRVGTLVGEQLGSFSRSLTVGNPSVEAKTQ